MPIGSPFYPPLVIPNSHAAGGRERDLTMQSRYCGRRETASGACGHMLIRATSMPLHKQGTVPLLRSFGPQVRDDKENSSKSAVVLSIMRAVPGHKDARCYER